MADKLWFLMPEMCLFVGAVLVSVLGLSRSKAVRDMLPLIVCLILGIAFTLTPFLYSDEDRLAAAGLLLPKIGMYVKMVICVVGVALAMLSVGVIDRRIEAAISSGRAAFDPIRVNRGEYFAFFLLSLMGAMLCCNANDLIWLFLALELTSLPTYIMVAMSRGSRKAQEAAMKYFFLGAMSAAMFLYGFALLYGSTGTIVLSEMRDAFAQQAAAGGINLFGIVGMILALLGISFKIAAAPMHFYAADVYEGAAAPVTAFLAFVPKTAGMIAIILLLSTMGWTGHLEFGLIGLPQPIVIVLWMLAVLTMTLGNVGALLQTSTKRLLAYSSIAHSGYMLIGIIAGPVFGGINAVLFYLLVYGLTNTGAFAVLASLHRRGEEVELLSDLSGLRHQHRTLAIVLAIMAGSLIGLPPLLGFVGKLFLLISAVEAGQIALVVIAGLNSAVSVFYYLKLIDLSLLREPVAGAETIERTPTVWPRVAGVLTATAVVVLPFFAGKLAQPMSEESPSDGVTLMGKLGDVDVEFSGSSSVNDW